MTYFNKDLKSCTRKTFSKRLADFCKDNEILILLSLAIIVVGFDLFNTVAFFLDAK